MRILTAGLVLLATIALAAAERGASAQVGPPDRPEAESACRTFIDCDCNGIRVGVLTGEWRKQCRACQARKRAACVERFLATRGRLGAGLKEAGYCDACSTYGPDARPLTPPPAPKARTTPALPRQARLFACPKGQTRTVRRAGGRLVTGCTTAQDRPDGLWVVMGASGEIAIEILYSDGRIVWQRVHSGE